MRTSIKAIQKIFKEQEKDCENKVGKFCVFLRGGKSCNMSNCIFVRSK